MTDHWQPEDDLLHGQLLARNQQLRADLCTTARLGVGFRQAAPERARAWCDRLAVHPVYKAGQFLFDLTEWEDFMLDGPEPPISLQGALHLFQRVAAYLNYEPPIPAAQVVADTLPKLEVGFYLYRDVVLGLIYIALQVQGASGSSDKRKGAEAEPG